MFIILVNKVTKSIVACRWLPGTNFIGICKRIMLICMYCTFQVPVLPTDDPEGILINFPLPKYGRKNVREIIIRFVSKKKHTKISISDIFIKVCKEPEESKCRD